MQALSDIVPKSFGSFHLLRNPRTLVHLAARFDAPVIVLPLVDERPLPAFLLIQRILERSPYARVVLFVRGRSAHGGEIAEAIRAGATEVLLDGDDWTAALERVRQRWRPTLRRY